MQFNTVIITGAAGLIGSECVKVFSKISNKVIGIDCDKRSYFFGEDASTKGISNSLNKISNVQILDIDITDRISLSKLFGDMANEIDIIIHTAAQPSHDWAAKEPWTDFDINAGGTIALLELYRLNCPDASFIFTSTNKVYGDRPNYLDIYELNTRYECDDLVNEKMSIDACKHSIFGASKVAADIMVQEYGRYFGLNTVSFRCGCLTGGAHRGAELHGFLAYLAKCIMEDLPYTIFGYNGKQVRDNLHSRDLVEAFLCYHTNPKPGEVYNIGGGAKNSVSIIEAIDIINKISGKSWQNYSISEDARIGDHQWYITDNGKFKRDYDWDVQISIDEIIKDIIK